MIAGRRDAAPPLPVWPEPCSLAGFGSIRGTATLWLKTSSTSEMQGPGRRAVAGHGFESVAKRFKRPTRLLDPRQRLITVTPNSGSTARSDRYTSLIRRGWLFASFVGLTSVASRVHGRKRQTPRATDELRCHYPRTETATTLPVAMADLRCPCRYAELHGERADTENVIRRPNVLGVSCAAGPACRNRSGAAVAANDVRSTEWRVATAVTPSRWR
jgi:hypothetical protein